MEWMAFIVARWFCWLISNCQLTTFARFKPRKQKWNRHKGNDDKKKWQKGNKNAHKIHSNLYMHLWTHLKIRLRFSYAFLFRIFLRYFFLNRIYEHRVKRAKEEHASTTTANADTQYSFDLSEYSTMNTLLVHLVWIHIFHIHVAM